jgi:polyhydroxyalkanoate synthesis regulator phasin
VPVPQSKNPRRAAGSRRTRSHAAVGPALESDQSFRDQLLRLVNPLELVVLTRERLQEAFDEAVQRGRLTRPDAAELVTELLSRGRRQTEELLAELEQLAIRTAPGDDLTAAQVQARLDGLARPELRRVRDYERRNANRKSVLQAIEQKLG